MGRFGHFGSFLAIVGRFGTVLVILERFFQFRAILGRSGRIGSFLGHFGAILDRLVQLSSFWVHLEPELLARSEKVRNLLDQSICKIESPV